MFAEHLENTPNTTLETMIDVISRWRNMGTNFSSDNRAVANFVSNKSDAKKFYSKDAKSRGGSERSRETRKCLVCDRVGHLVKDCRDPRGLNSVGIEERKIIQNSAVEAASETRAKGAASEARVETANVAVTEAATGAVTEAEVLMIEPSDHILTDPSPRKLGWIRAGRKSTLRMGLQTSRKSGLRAGWSLILLSIAS